MFKIQDDDGVIFSSNNEDEVRFEFEKMTRSDLYKCEKCGWIGCHVDQIKECTSCETGSIDEYSNDIEWSGDLELVEVLDTAR